MRVAFNKKDQNGLASIVVVGVLIVLLTLITVGFSILMNRSVNNALNSQEAAAANYAAQSGINDVVNVIKNDPLGPTDPALNSTTCNGYNGKISSTNLSSDSSTSISCVLVNNQPQQIVYSPVDAYTSEFINLTSYKLNNLMFSWSSADGKSGDSPSPTQLPDQQTWNYIPMLRVEIYQVQSGVQSFTSNTSNTFFLMPNGGAAGGNIRQSAYGGALDGKIISVNCNSTKPLPAGKFQYDASYQCNATINGLAAKNYYLRITPLYDQASIKVQALDNGNNPVKFQATQAVIDVTAKSGNAIKRLQERVDVDTNSEDIANSAAETMPESALRTQYSLCKRMVVDPSTGFSLDVKSSNDCAATSGSISVNTDAVSQAYPIFTLNADVTSALPVSSCNFAVSKKITYDSAGHLVPDTVSGKKMLFPCGSVPSGAPLNKAAFSYAWDASIAPWKAGGYLKPGLTLYYQASATDAGGNSDWGGILKFAESPPDPIPTTSNATILSATSARLNGTVNPNSTAVNAYNANYPPDVPTSAKPISGCFFVYWDEKTPSTLLHINCAQGIGAGVKAVAVTANISKLVTDDRYWYYVCGSKDSVNAQGIEYGHTVCDQAHQSIFVPRPLPVIADGKVNAGALIQYNKSGTTLPTVIYNGTITTNGWTMSGCAWYWNSQWSNSSNGVYYPNPLQNITNSNCDQNLGTLNSGSSSSPQPISATVDISKYNPWHNTWFYYINHGQAYEPENNKVTWGNYGASMCFDAGHAGTNTGLSVGQDGNCGQVCNCNGCGIGSAPGSCDSGGGSSATVTVCLNNGCAGGQSWSVHVDVGSDGDTLDNCAFYQGGSPGNPTGYIASKYYDWRNQGQVFADDGSNNYPLPGGTGLIHCTAVDGSDGWSNVVSQQSSLSITQFDSSGIWDQGPQQCDANSGVNGQWLCRNNPDKISSLNGSTCADGVHRWTTCSLYWGVSGGSGSGYSCTFDFTSIYNGASSDYGSFTRSGPSYQSQEGWVNEGAVTYFNMTLNCKDSAGHTASQSKKVDHYN